MMPILCGAEDNLVSSMLMSTTTASSGMMLSFSQEERNRLQEVLSTRMSRMRALISCGDSYNRLVYNIYKGLHVHSITLDPCTQHASKMYSCQNIAQTLLLNHDFHPSTLLKSTV